MASSYQVWRDRKGRVSPLRLAALAILLLPVGLAAEAADRYGLGARPLKELIQRTGAWALVFLLASLAVTPLRRIARFAPLADLRRMIGVGAFAYAAAHLTFYAADQGFAVGRIVSEIALRLYLTIGFLAWIGLAALAATSTDGAVRALGGKRWRGLHRASYAVAMLALVHHFQQTRLDMTAPFVAAGLFGWLMAYRLALTRRRGGGELSAAALGLLAAAAAALTFLAETLAISLMFGAPPFAVLGTIFDFGAALRPGWIVSASALAVAALALARARRRGPPAAGTLSGSRGIA